jgi:hypothetical protein
MNSDSFFFQDASFGRDKYLLERRLSQQSSENGSHPPTNDMNEENFQGSPVVMGEKSRFYTGGPQVKEPLLGSKPH